MQPGQSEKGVASNPVLVSCMERAALVNYQELYHHFLAQKEGNVGEGGGVSLHGEGEEGEGECHCMGRGGGVSLHGEGECHCIGSL